MTDAVSKVPYTGPKTGGGPYKAKGKTGKRLKSVVSTGPKSIIPVNLYVSKCCNALGKKTPLTRSGNDKEDNKYSENHLGVFRCSQCNGHSIFSSQLNTKGEAISL